MQILILRGFAARNPMLKQSPLAGLRASGKLAGQAHIPEGTFREGMRKMVCSPSIGGCQQVIAGGNRETSAYCEPILHIGENYRSVCDSTSTSLWPDR